MRRSQPSPKRRASRPLLLRSRAPDRRSGATILAPAVAGKSTSTVTEEFDAAPMPVNYTPTAPGDLLPVPGVALGTARAAIKNWSRDDLLLVRLESGAQAAGVFTRNRFSAAPVTVCREHLERAKSIGALVVNAGNANAGTGEQGLADARAVCAAAAKLVECSAEAVLPFST